MGKATLSFDQITIINKRSDTNHNDNDWLTIVWFVQDTQVRTDTFQLVKPGGDGSLDSASTIAPCAFSVDCNDGDLVTATFVVVNLGSTDGAGQRAQAENIAKVVAKGVADLYVQAAELVVKEGVPFGKVFSDGLDQLRPAIVDTVGTVFDDYIIPGIEEVLGILGIGPPNCNGEVLHDIAVFSPNSSYPITVANLPYTAESPAACGTNPHTSVILTLEREFATMTFPNTPAPATELVPVQGQSEDLWLRSWAEDPNTPQPIVKVIVSRSLRASGLYSVQIHERVDPVHDVVYETGADPISIHPERVVSFGGDVFGTVRPWLAFPLAPGNARAVHKPIGKLHAKSRAAHGGQHLADVSNDAVASAATGQTTFSLEWSRPGIGTPIGFAGRGAFGAPELPGIASDLADAIHLADRGIYLCLYEIRQAGQAIGHAIRYLRPDSFSYTHADVMLFAWNPL